VRRLALRLVLFLTILCAAGALYQWQVTRSASGRYPAPGQLIDIGGRRLHLICIGPSNPGEATVVFEPSGFGNGLSSKQARETLAANHRVCSYDRAGTGWSDPGPDRLSASVLASDLEKLLERAPVPPPYVLVASSVGGLTAEFYARTHPDRVAGLVMLDAANSLALSRFLPVATPMRLKAACLPELAARVGLVRLIDPFHVRGWDSAADRDRGKAQLYSVNSMRTFCGYASTLLETHAEFLAAPPLRADLPMVVLTAGIFDLPDVWGLRDEVAMVHREKPLLHERFAKQSSRGIWRLLPDTKHLIGNDQPEEVVRAVLEILR
jgi:pimeloyl-ACP methyl ester carboxylesterase